MKGRWIRLDTTWSTSEWLANLSPAARLCWIELLCYVKAHGISGTVKTPALRLVTSLWGVTRDNVTEMLDAATRDNALIFEDGKWVVTGWDDYQKDQTAAERQRRYRTKQKEDTEDTSTQPSSEAKRNVTPVTRDTRSVTPTKTLSKRSRASDWAPNVTHEKIADEEGIDLAREAVKFTDHHDAKGSKFADWDKAFCNWLRRAKDMGGWRAPDPPRLERTGQW